jgi:hypothetical protein
MYQFCLEINITYPLAVKVVINENVVKVVIAWARWKRGAWRNRELTI